MKKIKNIEDLRNNLLEEMDSYYGSSKTDSDLNRLSEVSKISSAVIRSAKVELEYAKYKGVSKDIEFLTVSKKSNLE